jgi:membrane protease YdiL (CAAX protease family)
MTIMRRTVWRINLVTDIIALVVGATLAISFVGFLAWKVEALPLDVIVTVCAVLMVYALYDDALGRKQNGSNRR